MYSADESDNPRVFNPYQQVRASRPRLQISKPSDILHHDTDAGISKLLLYIYAAPDKPRVEKNTLVVAIAGATSNTNSQPGASYGIFFAPDSPLNCNGKVPDSSLSSKAEIYALSRTLDILEDKFADDVGISRVVIITESTYLVDCLTTDIWDWEYNGYKNAKGRPVANGEVFRELQARLVKLEGDGMDVCFWDVDEEWNVEAHGLASAALGVVGF